MIDFNKLEAVIWDMDGVLLDSSSVHFAALRETAVKYGVTLAEDRFQSAYGMTAMAVVPYLACEPLDEALLQTIVEEMDGRFQKMISSQAEFLPGVPDWLDTFRNNGIKQGLASSGAPGNITTILDALKIEDAFDLLVSGKGMPSKPAPDIFLKAAKELGMTAERCLVIEDSIAGVTGAKAAGMRCVAVETSNPASLLEAADLVVENLSYLTVGQVQALFL